jgi:hypothetical protein
MSVYKGKALLLLVVFFTMSVVANAQQEFTLYHIPVLYQSTFLNPIAVPEHKFSFSLLPSTFVGFNNSAFSVKALVDKKGNVDYDKFINGLSKNRNYIGIGVKEEIFHLQLKIANNFISIGSQVINDFRFTYPKDLLAIGATGIKDGYSLSGLGINFNSYIEHSVGFTRVQPDSRWTYGGKFKLLKGIANVQTKKSEIELTVDNTDIYNYNLNANLEVNVGAGVDGNQYTSLDDIQDITINSYSDVKDIMKLNTGYAVDLAARLQLSKRSSFQVSLINLGFINWKNFAQNYKINSTLTFDGATIDNINFGNNIDSLFSSQLDSIVQSYETQFKDGVDTTNVAYKSWLPTQLFISLINQSSHGLTATASLYAEFYKGVSIGPVIGLNTRVGRNLNLTTSWWWFKKSAINMGLGIVYKPWYGQFYIIMDNILPASFVKVTDPELELDGVYLPYQMKNFNIRVGLNIVIGKIREESQLPLRGLRKREGAARRYLYKPSNR